MKQHMWSSPQLVSLVSFAIEYFATMAFLENLSVIVTQDSLQTTSRNSSPSLVSNEIPPLLIILKLMDKPNASIKNLNSIFARLLISVRMIGKNGYLSPNSLTTIHLIPRLIKHHSSLTM